MIERIIDYMQCSLMYREQTCIDLEHKKINGFGFYPRGYEDELGVRRYFGNNKSKKAFCIYSGRALHNHRVVGWDNIETIEKLLSNGANFTRLDMCITELVEDDLVQVEDVEHWYQSGLIDSTLAKYGAKKIVSLEDHYQQSTETLYIGDIKKRGDKGIFRAYDKGVELDLGKFLITRLEYEDRKEKAHTSAKRLVECENVGSVFKTRFNVDSEVFERLVDAHAIDTSRGAQIDNGDERQENENRWSWLHRQVAPSLRKAIQEDVMLGNGNENLQKFLDIAGIASIEKMESKSNE